MLRAANGVQSVTIVDRRSGPGFRLVLCRMTSRGTPIVETLDDSFATVALAERFAVERLGVDHCQVRTKLRTPA